MKAPRVLMPRCGGTEANDIYEAILTLAYLSLLSSARYVDLASSRSLIYIVQKWEMIDRDRC